MPTFAELGVPDDLCDALDARRLTTAFPIQVVTIPPALQGRDVCGRAPTGSGKTLAFGIPLVASVERARPKRPRALVLVPTRELAAQVANDLTWLGAGRDVRVHAFYGGVRFETQIKALRRGVDIAVACPGRLADLINQGIVRLDGVDRVVIDEADRMADMGFLPEVKRLIDQTDPARQVVLFSATLDGDVDTLIERYQHDPIREDVTPDVPKVNLTHHFWTVKATERVETTADIVNRMGSTIVFTRTRHGADRVARQLEAAGVSAVAIHGNRSQNQRERALRDFTSGRAQAMVATDVAARGIHVDAVECVVHFDLPADHKDYVHRSGRTGRAGSTGVVVALVMPDKRNDAKRLAKALDLDVETSPVVLDALPEPSEESKRTAHTHKSHSSRNRQTDRSRQGRPSRNDGGRPTFDDARPGKPRRAKHGGHNPTKGKPTNRKSSNGKPTSGDQRTGRPESRTTQDGTAGPTKARKSKPSAGKPKSGNAGFSKEGTPKKSWGPSKPGTTKSKAHKRAGGPAKRSGGRGPTNAAAGGRRPR